MQGLHRRIAALIGWLAFVFFAARFDLGPQATTFLTLSVYVVSTMAAIAPLSQFVRRQGPAVVGGELLALYVAALLLDPQRSLDQLYLYLALTGLLLIAITYFLAWRLGMALVEFFEALETVIFSSQGRFLPSIQDAQQQIGTQLYTSRRTQRPLSLILIDTNLASLSREPNQVVKDVQAMMAQRYLQTTVAKELANELRRSDLIIGSTKQGRLVLLAPDTNTEGAQVLGQRMVSFLSRQLGLKVNFSLAAFPDQGFTFEGLLEAAGEALPLPGSPPLRPPSEEEAVQRL